MSALEGSPPTCTFLDDCTLCVTFHLPTCAAAAEVDLDVSPHSVELRSEDGSVDLSFNLPLPAGRSCDEDTVSAKWAKDTRTLTLTLPLLGDAAPEEAVLADTTAYEICGDVDGREGRFLQATRPIAPGEVVLEPVDPLICVIDDSVAENRCHYCYEALGDMVLACGQCSFSKFCSVECEARGAEDSHHPWVCNALGQVAAMRTMLAQMADQEAKESWAGLILDDWTAIRQVLVLLVLRAVAEDGTAAPPMADAVERQRVVCSLVSNQDRLSSSQRQTLTRLATAVGMLLPEEISGSPELFVQLWCTVNCNRVALLSELSDATVGSGIYSPMFLLNHECAPTCCYVNGIQGRDLRQLTVRAMRPIEPGQQLSITYLSELHLPRLERRSQLLRKYFFSCGCSRCCEPLTPAALDALVELCRCLEPGCVGVLLPGSGCVECSTCGASCSTNDLKQRTDAIKAKHNKALAKQSPAAKLAALEKLLQSARKQLQFPTHWIGFSLVCAARILCAQVGETRKELEYLEEMGQNMAQLYHPNHFLGVDVLRKVVGAARAIGGERMIQRADQAVEEAHRVLCISHGSDHPYTCDVLKLAR